jgi:muconolactone delta-isomerase
MKFLAVCSPRDESLRDRFFEIVPDEVEALRRLKSASILLEAWSPGGPGAVLIIEAPSDSTAHDIVAELPLAVAGLIEVDVTPLHDLGV